MKALYRLIVRSLSALGMSAAVVFLLGYTYAQIPLVQKTCTPDVMDRVFK